MGENTAESAATVPTDWLCGTQGWNTIGAGGGQEVSAISGSLKQTNRAVLLESTSFVCGTRTHAAKVKPRRFLVQRRCVDVDGILRRHRLDCRGIVYRKEKVACPSGTGPPEGALELHYTYKICRVDLSHIQNQCLFFTNQHL